MMNNGLFGTEAPYNVPAGFSPNMATQVPPMPQTAPISPQLSATPQQGSLGPLNEEPKKPSYIGNPLIDNYIHMFLS